MQLPVALVLSLAVALAFRFGIGFLSRRIHRNAAPNSLLSGAPSALVSSSSSPASPSAAHNPSASPISVFARGTSSNVLATQHAWCARAVDEVAASCCPIFDFCAAQQAQHKPRLLSGAKQARTSFGRVLDAGTGGHSLEWLIKLKRAGAVTSIWALTGDLHREKSMRKQFGKQLHEALDARGNDAGESSDVDPAQLEACALAMGIQEQATNFDEDNIAGYKPGKNSTDATVVASGQAAAENIESETSRLTPAAQLAAHFRDRIFTGNWKNDSMLESEQFDVIVADYLLGSVDAFAPYFQDRLLGRLRKHLATDGRLYFVGMEPWPDQEEDNVHGQLIIDIAKARDACILLAGERPYREYPMSWVLRNLKQSGYDIVTVGYFEIVHSKGFVEKQISVAEAKLPKIADTALAGSMARRLSDLRRTVRSMKWGVSYGDDYVIVAKKRERSVAHDVVAPAGESTVVVAATTKEEPVPEEEPLPELVDDIPGAQPRDAVDAVRAPTVRQRPSGTAASVESQARVFPIDDESGK